MYKLIRKIILILNVVAAIVSLIWFIAKPDYEPFIVCVSSVAVALGIWIYNYKTSNSKSLPEKPRTEFNQTAGKNSKQYQAGRDMTINDK